MGDATEFRASSLSDLDRLVAFVARACERAGADADSRFALHLAVEEAFINVMRHGYGPNGGPVTVSVRLQGDRISVTMRDHAPPFDPGDAPAPDLGSDWQHRDVGGLGVYLMKKMVDDMAYVHDAESGNILTLIKEVSRVATGS